MHTNTSFSQKLNLKIYPIYLAFAFDLLVYYSIVFLFLTQEKGMDASQILLADSFYPIFKIVLQLPCSILVDKFGKKVSLLFGNVSVAFSIFLILFANSVPLLIVSNFFSALGFLLKEIIEPSLLDDSIPNSKAKGKLFSKLWGKGSSIFYCLDAIFSIASGFLFLLNPYVPILLCLICCLIPVFLSFRFTEFVRPTTSAKKNRIQAYLKEMKSSFSFIFHSKRLKSYFTYLALFTGIIGILNTLKSSLLTDLEIPAQYFGIIGCVLNIFAAIASSKAEPFHQKYRNRTLTKLALFMCFSFLFCGFVVLFRIHFPLSIILIFLGLLLQIVSKSCFQVISKRYLNNFASPNIKTRIYSAKSLLCSIFRCIITYFCSVLLGFTSTAYTYVILGCLFSLGFIFSLTYMKPRFGLKPEEYKKSDIEYLEVK